MIIALLLIVQSFFNATLAYADAPAPELPQSAVSDPTHTVTDAVYGVPNLEPPREIPSNTPPSFKEQSVQNLNMMQLRRAY